MYECNYLGNEVVQPEINNSLNRRIAHPDE